MAQPAVEHRDSEAIADHTLRIQQRVGGDGKHGHEQPQSRDEAEEERAVMAVAQTEEQQRVLFNGLLAEEFYAQAGVRHQARFFTSSRGVRLFTQTWVPEHNSPRALICCCHGYSNDTSWTFQLTCIHFAAAGYAVCALDYEGHGRSAGLHGFFRSADAIADDCLDFFSCTYSLPAFQNLPCYLFGESFGGAIAILITFMSEARRRRKAGGEGARQQQPQDTLGDSMRIPHWAGFLLMSPMLRIREEMQPHWFLVMTLKNLAYVFPDAAVVPSPDTIMSSCKDPERLQIYLTNPLRYKGKPRLAVAVELLRVTQEMQKLMPGINLPFFVAHGEADVVTDCSSSQVLYNTAASLDKTLNLYPGGGHQLLQGDVPELRKRVWHDVLSWLDAHVSTIH